MVNYIILGPPGSGKGTQAKKLAEKLGLFYFGTGDLMRKEAEKGTPLGKEFQAVWDKGQGELVSEELTDGFFEEKIRENLEKSIVFDGFPRTLSQVRNLEKIYGKLSTKFKVLNIEVSSGDLIQRMQTRRVCSKCGKIFFRPLESGIRQCDVCGGELTQRQEDTPETIKKRIEVYNKETQPVIDYYKEKGILINIDGAPAISAVEKEIWEKVNE